MRNRVRGALVGLGALAAAHCAGPAPDDPLRPDARDSERPVGGSPADRTVYGEIERVRIAAERIVVDGAGGDWRELHSLEDLDARPIEDPALDVVSAAIAPRVDDILVMLRTRAAPLGSGSRYNVTLDVCGTDTAEFSILLYPGGAHEVFLLDDDGDPDVMVQSSEIEVVVGEVVEVRIPHRVLGYVFAFAGRTPELPLRPWIRGRTHSYEHTASGPEIVDLGPAIASYRLVQGRHDLDSPLPVALRQPVEIPCPFRGLWYVSQGPLTSGTHAGKWAYDLDVRDRSFRFAPDGGSSPRNEDYAWSAEVHSPASGEVVEAWGREPDDEAGGSLVVEDARVRSNSVGVRLEDGTTYYVSHLRNGSVAVAIGDRVEAGALLGRVGSSGRTQGPHLHVEAYGGEEDESPVPIILRGVRVRLNPGEADPWARDLESWDLREGYFVERIPDSQARHDGVR